jgi:perosamine synthetase
MRSIGVFKPLIVQEAIDEVVKTLASGWIGLGPKVEEFEMLLAKYFGVDPQSVIAVNSGTAALHLAVMHSGVKDGDEVITTANTFVSTNHVILYAHGIPVFCDIDSGTGCIDSSLVERLITSKTRAIMVVHFAGYPCNLENLKKIADEHGLFLVEDCAHAMGISYKGAHVGTVGDFGAFSFHAVKNLPVGDGGVLVVKDKTISGQIRSERWLGIDKDTRTRERLGVRGYEWQYSVPYLGFKYHMNDITATIGIEQFKYLERHNARRREIANYAPRDSACHFYPILFESREKLILHLKSYGIHPGVHYKRNDSYSIYEQFRTELLQTEWFTSRELTLPIHLYLSDRDVEFIVSVICKGW